MTTEKMLIELYESNWLRKQCLYVTRNFNTADFVMSEITIKILEKDDDKLLELYNECKHFNYIYTMIKNEYISKYSNTYKYILTTQEVELKNNESNNEDI